MIDYTTTEEDDSSLNSFKKYIENVKVDYLNEPQLKSIKIEFKNRIINID